MGKFNFFKSFFSLFGNKKKDETCCQHEKVEPVVEAPVETTEVDKITERLIDVSTKPLTEVKIEESVKEIKSKSRKNLSKTDETKVEEPKSEKPKKKLTKKNADKKTK